MIASLARIIDWYSLQGSPIAWVTPDHFFWELVPEFDTNIHVVVLSKLPLVARCSHTNDFFLLAGRRFAAKRGFAEVDIQAATSFTLAVSLAKLRSVGPVAHRHGQVAHATQPVSEFGFHLAGTVQFLHRPAAPAPARRVNTDFHR
jgi:hypothetical protein